MTSREGANRKFFVGLSRAFGGAVFFSLPLLMTMEMWHLGFYLDRYHVAAFVLLTLPMLVALDHFSGFMRTSSWFEDAIDGLIAFGVGALAAAAILLPLGLIAPGMPLQEVAGKIALQAVPGSLGAVLANSQFSADREQEKQEDARRRRAGYPAQLLFMVAGSVFFAFNIAPTEEIVLLAAMLTPWHALAVLGLTVLMMHAFVYASRFRGMPEPQEGVPAWSLFLRYTLVGYAAALLVSAMVLWTFGRIGLEASPDALEHVVLLGLPAGLGAAAARLVL